VFVSDSLRKTEVEKVFSDNTPASREVGRLVIFCGREKYFNSVGGGGGKILAVKVEAGRTMEN